MVKFRHEWLQWRHKNLMLFFFRAARDVMKEHGRPLSQTDPRERKSWLAFDGVTVFVLCIGSTNELVMNKLVPTSRSLCSEQYLFVFQIFF